MNSSHRAGLALKVLTLGALAAVLVGCGGSDDKLSSAGGDSDAGRASAYSPEAPSPASATAGDDLVGATRDGMTQSAEQATGGKAAAIDPLQRAVISTGSLRLESKDPDDARRNALNLITGMRGTVAEEQTTSDRKGRVDRVDLTLRVPSKSFEKALDELGKLGTVVDRQQAAEDVTTQVIDIEARLKAQAASVASIRSLLARATSINDIVNIEGQLTRRQAELDSLTQQQRYLADQTSMSTIAVSIVRPEKTEKKDEPRDGFIGGLENGWEALGDTTNALGKGLGAVLPFAAVLVVIGGVARLVRRRS